MRPLCILVAGDPVPVARQKRGGFAALVQQAVGDAWPAAFLEVDARVQALPDLGAVSGVVITGSASSVMERAPWMLTAEVWLRSAVERETPVLGICFGHQMLGQALGGRVEKNPRGREIGSVPVDVFESDPLIDGGIRPYLANTTHVDSVVELPAGAQVLARTEREPHAALRFADQVYGVQFHPEFDAEVMRYYLETRRDKLVEEGLDADTLIADATDTPASAAVLIRFALRVAERA